MSKHLALFEDFVAVLADAGRRLEDIDIIARRLVHVCVLHRLLPEISANVPGNNNGASVPTTEARTS